jgi:FlaA1/EpsC-like NDP-sugar epimerase
MRRAIDGGRPYVLRSISVCYDVAVAGLSFYLAYVTIYGVPRAYYVPGLEEKAAAFSVISLVCFYWFSVTRGSWRFVSIPELIDLIKASVAAIVIYTVAAFLVSRGQNIPRSVPVLTTIFMITGLAGSRLIYRLFMDGIGFSVLGLRKVRPGAGRYVLVYGVTNEAEGFLRTTQRSRGEIVVVGIVDDRKSMTRSLQGVPVLGDLSKLGALVKRFTSRRIKVTELVVAISSPDRQKLSEIVERANSAGLKVTRLPDITETTSITSNSLFEPKPIEIGDLLGRPEVHADIEGVARLVHGKVVLATGAGGSIGSELCRQVAAFNPKQLIITDNSEFHIYMLDKELRENHPQLHIVTRIVNVRDTVRVGRLFEEFKPEVVFHAAALKHVPLVEENPVEGIKTNILGTKNVADAALANKTSTFVMISTDKAVNPTNVMGATKRAAEAYCQSLDMSSAVTRFKTVRFGNVLGSNGSVVPRFQEQIAAGGPVTVTHPHIVRYFMTIPEAVRLVLHASARALVHHTERGRIMVLDMGDPVRIVDLAERMILLAGLKPHIDIDIAFTGLRPGEKLYEELFDPSEVQGGKTDEGYVIASPRVIDNALLVRTLEGLRAAADREDATRAVELLSHIVPEYKREASGKPAPKAPSEIAGE